MAKIVYNHGKRLIGEDGLSNLTIFAMLVTSGYTANADHQFVTNGAGDATDPAFNEFDDPSYAREQLSGFSSSVDAGADTAAFDFDNVTFTALDGDEAAGVIFYASITNDADSILLAWTDEGGFPFTANGSDLVLAVNAAGLFRVAQAA